MKLLPGLVTFGLIAHTLAAQPAEAPTAAAPATIATEPLRADLPTLFIAGDSTAARDKAQPIQGWGVPFADFFAAEKVNVANRAKAGRSSRTYITQGWWDHLMQEVKAGDIVLIQFGHNDGGAINEEPPGSGRPLRARGTLPGLGDESQAIVNALTHEPETVHTFGFYVRRMIADVKAKGARPILLSLTVRNLWTDGIVERGSGGYRAWDRELARETGISFVDLSRIVADEYQRRGPEVVGGLFGPDHVHTNAAGAELNAALVVAGLKGLRDHPVDAWLSAKGQEVTADSIGWLNLPEPANPQLPSLLLVGDSTVRNGGGDGAGGQWGWGDFLAAQLDPARVNLVNRAIGGLSSRTFRTQGHWERALTFLRRGDVVLIQFGHNDNGPLNDDSRARGTIPDVGDETETIDNQLTHQSETVHTYGWYLRQYVREARARGAIPIICSPVPRKVWREGRVERSTAGYAGWAARVAQEEQAGFIDLNARVAARYDALGEAAVEALFADAHTHTSQAGAELNAGEVAEGLRALGAGPWQDWLRSARPSGQ